MNIVVCVKQVPVTQDVQIDSTTNNLIRNGIESEINPFDTYALEEALLIKEKLGGQVIVLSMGIPSVASIIKKALAMGCDRGILLTDKRFAGSDSLATAYTLAKAIEHIGNVDLVVCGKQAIDGDTAQVGPSLAGKLNITHITCVNKVLNIGSDTIECERLLEDGAEIIQTILPTVITVVKGINNPRIPSLKGIIHSKNIPIEMWKLEDINADASQCGLQGSPTQVIKTFNTTSLNNIKWIIGNIDQQVKEITELLQKVI